MTLAQTWLRQAFGAAGMSLLVPVAILFAAGALAAGGGFGGLGSLSQIASGPSLPEPGAVAGGSALEEADIVGVDLSSPAAVAAGPASPALPPALGGTGGTGGTAPGGTGPADGPLALVPGSGGGGGGPGVSPPGSLTIPVPGGGAAPPGGGGSPGTNPVEDVVDTTRGISESLPEPIAPITNDILDLLLGPQEPR